MKELIELLERKNLCFRSFHKLCSDYVEEISQGDTSSLEDFQRKRQSLINVLEQLEKGVAQWLDSFDGAAEDRMKEQIARLMSEKDSIVRSILDLDLVILGHIDRVKDETIRKLQSVQSGRKTIGAYKSPMESIETIENKGD